jgi:Xaa-Pro aminopeptidase
MNVQDVRRGTARPRRIAGPAPHLSLAERDRRYAAVRQAMRRDGIDVLVLPASVARWEQTMADSRYLSAIGGFGTEALTIFGHDFVTTYVFNRADYWKSAQDWVADVRDGHNHWARNLLDRLGEAGIASGTLGIAGLAGLTRSPDGIIPYSTVQQVQAAFPALRIVNATDLMQRIRAVKSAEEIAVMTHATRIAEAMVEDLGALQPGDTDKDVYRLLTNRLLSEGGELPAMIIIGSGPAIGHGNFVPTDRKLMPGDIVIGEVEGRYLGYSGQIVRPRVLGSPPPGYADLVAVAQDCFDDVRHAMKAGATLGDILRTYAAAIARHGSDCKAAFPLMHARGLGDEIPVVVTPKDGADHADFVLEAGMVFVLKPRVARAGIPTAQVGDMVVVEPHGGRRLGQGSLLVGTLTGGW